MDEQTSSMGEQLFSNTFIVYAQVLNNLVLINFKTEMDPGSGST